MLLQDPRLYKLLHVLLIIYSLFKFKITFLVAYRTFDIIQVYQYFPIYQWYYFSKFEHFAWIFCATVFEIRRYQLPFLVGKVPGTAPYWRVWVYIGLIPRKNIYFASVLFILYYLYLQNNEICIITIWSIILCIVYIYYHLYVYAVKTRICSIAFQNFL